MRYTILCYHNEEITSAWTEEEDAEVIECLKAVNRKWARNFEPIVRLMPTSAATTLRKSENIVTDGPFAETKEQLGGYYLLDCKNLDDAIACAAMIPTAEHGRVEVRPVMIFD